MDELIGGTMIRSYRRTNQQGTWDFHEVAAYLAGKGYLIGPGGIGTGLDPDDPTTVVVQVDIDANVPEATLAADLDAFVPTHSDLDTAQVAMRKAYADIRAASDPTDLPTALAQIAALRRAVLAFGVTLGV